MKRNRRAPFHIGNRIAACAAILFVWIAGHVAAQNLTLTSQDGSFDVEGRFIGYDGEYLYLDTEFGPLSVIYARASCAGDACPDPEIYVPHLRISGSADLTAVLLPTLLDTYAQAKGFSVEENRVDESHFERVWRDGSGADVARFSVRETSASEGFADLIAYDADVVISSRAPTSTEVTIAQELGLGLLTRQDQQVLIGLDAVVPATAPRLGEDVVLMDVFLTRMATNDPSAFLTDGSGIMQSFARSVAAGAISQGTTNADAYRAEIFVDDDALGALPFSELGGLQVAALVETCGAVLTASESSLRAGDYPFMAPNFLYLSGNRQPPVMRDFVTWLASDAAQLIVRRSGFVDIGFGPIPIGSQGQRFLNAINSAGPEVDLGELKRMARVVSPLTRQTLSFRFERGTNRLDAQSAAILNEVVSEVVDGQLDDQVIWLIGFTDASGDALGNRDLASARAEDVRRLILSRLTPDLRDRVRIETESFGEAMPIACDDGPWGRRINQRVEVWLGPVVD